MGPLFLTERLQRSRETQMTNTHGSQAISSAHYPQQVPTSSGPLFSLPSQAQLLGSYISTPPKPMKVSEIPLWGNCPGRISDREHFQISI